MRNLKQTELQNWRTEKERLRIEDMTRKWEIDIHEKQRLATLKRLKRGEVEEKPKTGESGC